MKKLKIIIEKKKNGVKVDVKGNTGDKKDVIILLVKTLINTSNAMNINLEKVLDEMSVELSDNKSKE